MPNLKVIWKNIIEFTTDNEEARSLPDGRYQRLSECSSLLKTLSVQQVRSKIPAINLGVLKIFTSFKRNTVHV